MKEIINIHYGAEITLKGGNRTWFENLLINNIRLVIPKQKMVKKESRLIIELEKNSDVGKILDRLGNVFGIEWYSAAVKTEPKMEKIEEAIEKLSQAWKLVPIKVDTKRADKSFKLNSMQVNSIIGQRLKNSGFPIDLTNAKRVVQIEILKDAAIISSERKNGLGGLPLSSAGNVLTLFSGGIDSPVASWLMMKRGCRISYLHVHSLPSNEAVRQSKIVKIIEQLKIYQPFATTLYVASYFDFYEKTFKLDSRYELILFRRFLVRLADALAKRTRAQGIVTGDNLAQVASQTLENLGITNAVAELPVYRPLIAYNKQEIIDVAKKVGTYQLSIQNYKDCCSLVAIKHPLTKPSIKKVEELEKEINIDGIVNKTLEKIEEIKI